jgi:hypothetical protein
MFQEIKEDDKSAEAHIILHKNTNVYSFEMFFCQERSNLMVNAIKQF